MQKDSLTWSFALACCTLFLLTPGAGATAQDQLAVKDLEFLEEPVQQIVDEISSQEKRARANDAIQAHAYWAALTLANDAIAAQEAEETWAAASSHKEPFEVFLERLHERMAAADARIAKASIRVDEMETGATASGAEKLLVAAHAVVQAGEAARLGGAYLVGVTTDSGTDSVQRYTLTRPFTTADLMVEFAMMILDAPVPSGGEPADIQAWAMSAAQKRASLGMPAKPSLVDEPSLMGLAQHVFEYKQGLQIPSSITERDLTPAVKGLHADHAAMVGGGFSGIRPAAAHADVSWWLAQADVENRQWGPLMGQLYRDVLAVRHEAGLLSEPSAQSGPSWWPWVLSGLMAAGIGGSIVWFMSRKGTKAFLPVLLAVAFAALLSPPLQNVEAAPSPSDPTTGDVPFSEATTYAGRATMAATSDGAMHFAWSECVGPASRCGEGSAEGRVVVRYRNLSPDGTWSPIETLRDLGQASAHLPQIHAHGNDVRVYWTEGYRDALDQPVTLWTCALSSSSQCDGAQRLSGASVQVPEYAVAIDADGQHHVAWQEETGWDDGKHSDASIFLRRQTETAWGPPVMFDTSSPLQRRPAVAVDDAGNAHVAWLERPAAAHPAEEYRLVTYGLVERGDSSPSRLEAVTYRMTLFNRDVAIAVDEDRDVHVAYGQSANVSYVHLADGSESWTEPVEIWNPARVHPRYVQLLPHEGQLMATWVDGAPDAWTLWTSSLAGGFWTEPRAMVGAPYDVLWPDVATVGGAFHAVWTSADPELDLIQVFYRATATPAPLPPSISQTKPVADTWLAAGPVDVAVTFRASHTLDHEQTSLSIDGTAYPFAISSDGRLTATISGLGEGLHEAVAIIHDAAGERATHRWSFKVDATPAPLTASINDPDGIPFEQGWGQRPLRAQATADAAGGSPARTQIRSSPESPWVDLPPKGLSVMEGIMLDMQFRSIDEVGNVHVTDRYQVGWDATPPEIQAPDLPAWTNTSQIRVPIVEPTFTTDHGHEADDHEGHDHGTEHDHGAADAATSAKGPGSPVHVTAELLDASGNSVAQVEAADDRIDFLNVPDGRYAVELRARDEAGNEQAPVRTSLFGVDSIPPSVELSVGERGAVDVAVRDATSGVSAVYLREPQQATREWVADGGSEFHSTLPSLADRSTITVVDSAGNSGTKVVRIGEGGISLEDVEPAMIHGEPSQEASNLSLLLVCLAILVGAMLCRGYRLHVNR